MTPCRGWNKNVLQPKCTAASSSGIQGLVELTVCVWLSTDERVYSVPPVPKGPKKTPEVKIVRVC